MAEFQGIFPSLSAISIDNKGGGWDGQWGGVGWDGEGWGGWGGRWQKPPLGTHHEQP